MLILCPAFIKGGKLGISGNAGSDSELIGRKARGQRGGEVNILHFV